MNSEAAKELIKNTFENPFDKDRFTWFLKNLFPDTIEFRNKLYAGNYIKEAYKSYIKKYEQIGKYEDQEGNTIDLLAVELLRGQSVERARTSQRNFIAQYLKNKNHREGALAAFYSEDSADWRFSLIKMEYSLETKKDELTPAKRFSFLVGKNEKSHTAQNQLAGLLTMKSLPVLGEIENSFNIETVTKEFFEKYKQLFLDLNEHIEKEIKKSKQLREELESKSIDAVSFTKKLLGQIVFLYFLQKKGWLGVPKNENWGKGDKTFLRTLLERAIANKENFFSDYLIYLFYEALATEHRGGSDSSYYKKLDCRIPFLNGGLFEADYNWEKIIVDIPNKFFTNLNVTKEGDIGDGILNVFDRYNFTVKEDEPLEKEVAVDPEMLGKVFENLLEVKDRKSKGAYYTPREIVHYMCQESLIAYLDTTLNNDAGAYKRIDKEQTDMFGNKTRKGQLVLESELGSKIKIDRKDLEKFIREGSTTIEHDEAKESGKLISKKYALPESIRKYAEDLDNALANIRICDPAIGSGAFPVGMMNEIVRAREILGTFLLDSKSKTHTAYELKRHTIQECIYGVDIDHSAIDIAKLRLWLSLVVDEEDFYKIKPLPNLDYKIMQGNSLVGYPYEPQGLAVIEKLKEKFFELTDLDKKKEYRKEINTVINHLLKDTEKSLGYKVDFEYKIHFSEVFHKKKGFDIVIGNPPYVDIKKLPPKDVRFYFSLYKTTQNRINLYSIFIEKGYNLLNEKGTLVYINPNSILINESYQKIRKYISESVNLIIKLPDAIFEKAIVETIILLLTKRSNQNYVFGKYYRNNDSINFSNITFNAFNRKDWLDDPETRFNIFTENNAGKLLKKIEINSEPLGKYIETSLGITPYDKYQGHSENLIKNRKYHSETKLSKDYVPLISGKNIHRYLITDEICEYLKYGPWLGAPREKKYFVNPKIIVRQIISGNPLRIYAGYSEKPHFFTQIGFSVISKNNDKDELKFLLSLLNSSLMNFYHSQKFLDLEKIIFQKILIGNCKKFPIKVPISKKPFITIVDKIIETKKQDANANTSSREKQIDVLVYQLYNLTYNEAKIIDPELTEEDFEKFKL